MSYPSTFSAFNRPTASDRLNSPSHSALHNTVSSAVGQLEAVIGLSTSSAVGTLYYDVRSPASGGGGHVQTANKGGTGQTSFSKGDMLVATSSSVIAKLAVGTAAQVLTVNPAQPAGIEWQSPSRTTISVSSVSLTFGAASVESTYFAASVAASVVSNVNALRFQGYLPVFNANQNSGFVMQVKLEGSTVGVITLNDTASSIVGAAMVDGMIVGNASYSSVQGFLQMTVGGRQNLDDTPVHKDLVGFSSIIGAVDMSRPRALTLTGQYTSTVGATNSVLTGLFTTERL